MYTKGEWRVSWNGYRYQIITDGGIDYKLIAESEGKANAQLMAAAPELYEALKEAENFFIVAKAYIPAHGNTLGMVQKALAKADGKQ